MHVSTARRPLYLQSLPDQVEWEDTGLCGGGGERPSKCIAPSARDAEVLSTELVRHEEQPHVWDDLGHASAKAAEETRWTFVREDVLEGVLQRGVDLLAVSYV